MKPSEFPDEEREIAKLEVELPRLPEDSPKGCPRSVSDVKSYLRAEFASERDPKPTFDLFFGRTAQIGGTKFWLWGFTHHDGRTYYVVVTLLNRTASIMYAPGDCLTPEQFVALQYARFFRARDSATA